MSKAVVWLLCLLLLLIEGCSPGTAGKKQACKDLSVIQIGGNRDDIVKVLGAPYMSVHTDDGGRKDIYRLADNGKNEEMKTLAIIGHTTTDVVTVGLWEVVGTPLEIASQKEASIFILYYDARYKLRLYESIQ